MKQVTGLALTVAARHEEPTWTTACQLLQVSAWQNTLWMEQKHSQGSLSTRVSCHRLYIYHLGCMVHSCYNFPPHYVGLVSFQPWSEQMIWQKSGLSAFWTFPPRWMSVCLLTWWLMKCKFSSDLRGHFLPHPKALYPSVNLVPVIFTMCLLGTVAIQGRCTGNLALCHYCQKPAVATSALWRKKGFFCSVVFCKLVKNCCFLALISVLQMVTVLLLGFLCAKNIPAQLPLQQHVCASPMEVTGHNCFTSLNFLTF